MFNIGVIAGRAKRLILLTDAQLYQALGSGTYYSAIRLNSNGTAQNEYHPTAADIPGQWRIAGGLAGFGSGYEARATLVAGATPNLGRAAGAWHSLSNDVRFGWQLSSLSAGGRILVEIRNALSGQVVASAHFYTSGYAP